MKKTCGVCKKEKSKSDFGVDKRKSDGLKYSCRECHNRLNNEYRNAHPENHRKVNLAYARSDRGKAIFRANALRRKFWPHLTNEQATAEYDRLLAEQKNCCAFCGKHQSLMKKAFDVDHCHNTGRVRGLLCHKCNYSIVKNHSEESLQRLAAYLSKK
jgi:hypothetical protein